MASTPFGEHLRRERELRGVSLDEVSAATRIKTSFLEALENGRWEELPGGAFNRGFIRATARFLGLDEDGMVAEYSLEIEPAAEIKPLDEPGAAMPRDYRPAAMAASAVLLILIAGAWLGHHEYWLHKQKRINAGAAGALAPQAAANSTGAESNSALSGEPPAGAAAQPAPGPGSAARSAANPGTPDPPPSPASATVSAAAAAKNAAAPGPLTLKIESSRRTEVKVVGDGKTLFRGHLRSDAAKTFEAKDNFEVSSADADRVRVELNGESVPFAATSGHKGKISLSRKDLKTPAESPR